MSKPPGKDPLGVVLRALEAGVGAVIPVVGDGVLTVPGDQGEELYYHRLARRLADELVDADPAALAPGFGLNEVIWSQPGFRGDTTLEKDAIVRLMAEWDGPLPEPLLRLAGIDAFRFFVSTTVDSLLERALTQVRGSPPAVITFPPNSSLDDCDDEFLARSETVVFQMLGRCPSSEFAITEGQVLAHVSRLLTGANRPAEILELLRNRHLLLLGVGFPEWLGRFLLRSMRPKPLWDRHFLGQLMRERDPTAPAGTALFVHAENPKASVVFADRAASEFIRQLAEQAPKRPPQTASPPHSPAGRPDGTAERSGPEAMPPGTIFVSYAHEDRPWATRFGQALRDQGIEVWIDEDGLRAGDEFAGVIEGLVGRAAGFVALLSSTTNRDEPRWFRREWRWALDRLPEFTGTSRKFLFPVMLEPLEPQSLSIRQFQARDIASAPGGEPPPDLVQALREVQRASRRQAR